MQEKLKKWTPDCGTDSLPFPPRLLSSPRSPSPVPGSLATRSNTHRLRQPSPRAFPLPFTVCSPSSCQSVLPLDPCSARHSNTSASPTRVQSPRRRLPCCRVVDVYRITKRTDILNPERRISVLSDEILPGTLTRSPFSARASAIQREPRESRARARHPAAFVPRTQLLWNKLPRLD